MVTESQKKRSDGDLWLSPGSASYSEKAMATHSSTLAWKIAWMEEPGRLQSMGSLGFGHGWVTSLFTFHFHALVKAIATHSSVLAWRIPGTGDPGGLLSMASHRVRQNWSDLAAAAASYYLEGPVIIFPLADTINGRCLYNSSDDPCSFTFLEQSTYS